MSAVADVSLACWVLLEWSVRIRERVRGQGRAERDRGTRVLIGLTIGAAVATAIVSASSPSPPVPAGVRAAGVAVMWLGLAVRMWAIGTLGGAFRTTVEVDPGQAVITTGPYRWVRHPSYTGLLLVVAGFGLAAGTWLSLAACLVVPLPAILWRIRVEEDELNRVLGDDYREYAATTARLVPRVW